MLALRKNPFQVAKNTNEQPPRLMSNIYNLVGLGDDEYPCCLRGTQIAIEEQKKLQDDPR